MNALMNRMRGEAGRAMEAKAFPRRGIISSYDPAHYAAKVRIQPEGYETGFLPVGCPWVGPGWGMFCPPSPGDEVDVHFQEGGKNAAYVVLRFYGAQAQPLSVPSGEFWLVDKAGSFVKFTGDQKLSVNGHLEIDLSSPTINITASSTVNVTAPAINLGSTGETLHSIVNDNMVNLFNSHTHDHSPVPDQQMGSTHITTVVKAG